MSTLSAYRVPPQMEFKAAKELDRLGVPHLLPTVTTERVSRKQRKITRELPTMRGYSFPAYKHAAARHLRQFVGHVQEHELRRMWVLPPEPGDTFKPGDKVVRKLGHASEMIGTVRGRRRNGYVVAFVMCGKECDVFVKERELSFHTHPG